MRKEVIKDFIPPIILKLVRIFKANLWGLNNNKINISEIKKQNKSLIVLGNGPSLKKSYENYSNKFSNYDKIAVNFFMNTDYFGEIQPNLYLLVDPAFFSKFEDLSDLLQEKIILAVRNLNEKVDWDINFIIPITGKNSDFYKSVKNDRISFYYYNTFEKRIFYNKNKQFNLFDKNLISPPQQTVLNTAVYLGIYLKYQDVYIIGADSNWIEEIRVDQENNTLYCEDRHFYGTEKRLIVTDPNGKIPGRLDYELYSNAKAFESYRLLKEYSDYAEVNVYNASEYSLIDAFDRKKIE